MRILFILTCLIFTALTVSAQEVQEDEICLSFAHIWHGTPGETEKIKADPVPETFKQAFERTGCGRWQLSETSLLDWHAKYGNADTMTAAVTYMTEPVQKALNTPLSEDLAWQQAAHASIAYYYLMAAREFQTKALYRKAADHADKARDVYDINPWPNLEYEGRNYKYDVSSDFGISDRYAERLAPISASIYAELARVSGDEMALSKAEDIVKSETLERAMQWVLNAENIECDYDPDRSNADEDLCDLLENGRFYLVDYSTTKATIEAARYKTGLTDRFLDDPWAAAQIIRLYFLEQEWRYMPTRKLANLSLNYADAYYSRAKTEADNDNERGLYQCIEYADLAAQFSPAHETPSQWRRAADLYVKCARAMPEKKLSPDQQIALNHFERLVADLPDTEKSQAQVQTDKPEMTQDELVAEWERMQRQGVENNKACKAKIKNDWPDQGGGFLDDVSEDFKKNARIIYKGTPVTLDHVPGRLNIIVDEDTKTVISVHCG